MTRKRGTRVPVPCDRPDGWDVRLFLATPPAPARMSRLRSWAVRARVAMLRLGALVDRRARPERIPKLLNARTLERELGAKITRMVSQDLRIPRGAVIETRVRFRIGTDGVPKQVRVVSQDHPHAIRRLALQYAKKLRFRPAALYGHPVSVWVEVPLTFRVPPR